MRRLAILLLLAALTACSSGPAKHGRTTPDHGNDLVMYAMGLADTPYRYGGSNTASGFDCSGYVGHVYAQVLEIKLPRTSRQISRVGTPLHPSELHPGDLVFYNTQGQPYSHVGLYIGEGKFVHSPKSGDRIRVERMELNYWKSRYNGARRVY
ncbi:MAG: C40 family peptidase [Sideroxydans sp.]|jgi:cell wall-associated NlpC family hydrolase